MTAEKGTSASVDPVDGSLRCDHPSSDGDEGPVDALGRMPTRWRCLACGEVWHDDPCLCDQCTAGDRDAAARLFVAHGHPGESTPRLDAGLLFPPEPNYCTEAQGTPAVCQVCAKPFCCGWLSHAWERFRWACTTTRHAQPKTFMARLRLLWHDFILHALLHKGHERCQDCGRAYGLWHADNAEWLRVMGSPSGLLCASCFGARRG